MWGCVFLPLGAVFSGHWTKGYMISSRPLIGPTPKKKSDRPLPPPKKKKKFDTPKKKCWPQNKQKKFDQLFKLKNLDPPAKNNC